MRKISYAIRALYEDIKEDILWLSDIFTKGLKANTRFDTAQSNHIEYESINSDYCHIRKDAMEHNNMLFLLAIVAITIVIDYATLYHAMVILCSLGAPQILKYLVPMVLVFIEVGVSFFTSMSAKRLKYGSFMNAVHKYLPYFVIVLLMAFSALVIVYSLNIPASYDDILWQIMLLIASIMLHLWLIRHSQEIVLMIGYFIYRIKHNSLSKKKDAEAAKVESCTYEYSRNVPGFIDKIEQYYSQCGNDAQDITVLIPEEQIKAINKVMGKDVFAKYKNIHYEQIK